MGEGNKQNPQAPINLFGMLEGNAWTYMPIDTTGAIDTWVERAIVPKYQVDDIKKHCNLSYVGPLLAKRDSQCDEVINKAMSAFNYVDIYDIYVDICLGNKKMKQLKQMAKVSWFHAKLVENLSTKKRSPPLPPFDPCIDNHLSDYFNSLEVQKAINAVPQTATSPIRWEECSDVVHYDFNSVAQSVIPILKGLFERPDFHALVYSGDVDAIVPIKGTLTWIESLGRPIKEEWKAWLDYNGQCAGFRTVYDQFTFTSIRNAGHQVPEYQPARAYKMYEMWLNNQKI